MAMIAAPTDASSRTAGRPLPVPAGMVQSGQDAAADLPWFLDWHEILLTLRLRRLWVIVPVLLMAALACAALLLLPPHFTATTKLLIDPQGLQVVKDDLTPPGQTSDASLLLVDSQMQVLSSDDVLSKVVDRFGLDQVPEFDGRATAIERLLAPLFGHGAPIDPKLMALRTLRNAINVKREDRTFVLSISVTTANRDRSAEIAQGVAETYLTYDQQIRAGLAQRASGSVQARLGELQAEVRDAEDKAQAYRVAHNLVGTRTALVSEQQLNQVSEQLGAARAQAAEQLTRYNQVEAVLKSGALDSLPEVLQSTTISQLRTQLAQAERDLASSETRLGSRHPSLIAAESNVESARTQLNAEIRRIAASVRDQYKSAAANVKSLSTALDNGEHEAVQVGDAMVHMRELDRQVDARRSVYESFLVRARELEAQQQLGTSASRVISPATSPARHDGPPTALLMGVALMGAIGASLGCALGIELLSGRIRTAGRLSRHTSIPVIGATPPAAGRSGKKLFHPGSDPDYELALARLRHAIANRIPADEGRVIVVTAADHVTDKARLAVQLAAAGVVDLEGVLLIDADPDSSISHDFKLSVRPQPTRGKGAFGILLPCSVAEMPGLHYIDIDRSVKTDFKSVVDEIFTRSGQYHTVIVNAGLVGADLFTERLIGCAGVSLVLLAVSGQRTTFATLDHALARTDNMTDLALVLTDAEAEDL